MQSKTMTLSSKLVLHVVRFLSLQLFCINLVGDDELTPSCGVSCQYLLGLVHLIEKPR